VKRTTALVAPLTENEAFVASLLVLWQKTEDEIAREEGDALHVDR
jgi:hypothetical protein